MREAEEGAVATLEDGVGSELVPYERGIPLRTTLKAMLTQLARCIMTNRPGLSGRSVQRTYV